MANKIPQIGAGSGHTVLDTGDGWVTKVPRSSHFTFDQAERDLGLARKFFGPWLPETKIFAVISSPYQIQQEKIEGCRGLKKSDLQDPALVAELEKIIAANRRAMAEAGVSLDFLGLDGSAACVLAELRERLPGFAWPTTFRAAQIVQRLGSGSRFVPTKPLQEVVEPEISNVVFGSTANRTGLFLPDISLLRFHERNLREYCRAHFLQLWNTHFLRSQFGHSLD